MVKVIIHRDENNDMFIKRNRIIKKIGRKCETEIKKVLLPTDKRGRQFALNLDTNTGKLKYRGKELEGCADIIKIIKGKQYLPTARSLHQIDNKVVKRRDDFTETEKLRKQYDQLESFGGRTLRGAYAKAGTQETLLRNQLNREGFKGNVVPRGKEFIVRPEGSTYEQADTYNLGGKPTQIVDKALRDEVKKNKERADEAEKIAEENRKGAEAYEKITELASVAGSDIGMIQDIPDLRGGGIRGKIVSDRFFKMSRPIIQSAYDKRKDSIRKQELGIQARQREIDGLTEGIGVLETVRRNVLANLGKSTGNADQKLDLEGRAKFSDYIMDKAEDGDLIFKFNNLVKDKKPDIDTLLNKQYEGSAKQRREAFRNDWEASGLYTTAGNKLKGFKGQLGGRKKEINAPKTALDAERGLNKGLEDLIREGYIKDDEFTGAIEEFNPYEGSFSPDAIPKEKTEAEIRKQKEDAEYQEEQERIEAERKARINAEADKMIKGAIARGEITPRNVDMAGDVEGIPVVIEPDQPELTAKGRPKKPKKLKIAVKDD